MLLPQKQVASLVMALLLQSSPEIGFLGVIPSFSFRTVLSFLRVHEPILRLAMVRSRAACDAGHHSAGVVSCINIKA